MAYEPIMQPPRNPIWRRLGLILVAVVTLGCVCGGIALFRAFQDNSGPIRDATSRYLDDVLADDLQGAYGRMCEKAHSTMTQAEFDQIQAERHGIDRYEIVGTNISIGNGRASGSVDVRMVRVTGEEFVQRIELVKEDDTWRVCT
ncbi:DUF4878 domain-containing protein [Micromonospora sp. NPDC049523]|uniref:Rv0361 family membrane protein n=1 Tax=Micromonospora sp. NPDC049523 TaxID=3155921 RepID=UPI00342E7C78